MWNKKIPFNTGDTLEIKLIEYQERLALIERNQSLILNTMNLKVDEGPRLVQNRIQLMPDPKK